MRSELTAAELQQEVVNLEELERHPGWAALLRYVAAISRLKRGNARQATDEFSYLKAGLEADVLDSLSGLPQRLRNEREMAAEMMRKEQQRHQKK